MRVRPNVWRWWPIFGVVALGAACSPSSEMETAQEGEAAAAAPVLLERLGDHTHLITTQSAAAQRYFDQGLILTFGFNHEAAIRSFEEAARLDPDCAMCYWGIALALGPNINAPMGPDAGRAAYAALQQAIERAPQQSDHERAYIAALTARYAEQPPEDRAALDLAYAKAMRIVHQQDPEDVDAATLLAESLMDLYPWNYWTDDGKPREYTEEILSLLEGVLALEPNHVGANHYYIHAVEEYFPERGIASADRLAALGLSAGHLVHMPSHIYWRVGRYQDAVEINQRAAAADEAFFSICRAGPFYQAAYYPHNLHFLWAAASAEGRSEIALTTARKLEAQTSSNVAAFPFMQEFMAIPMFTLARFGRFDELLGTPAPAPELLYLNGVWHYTRGLARVRSGDHAGAADELAGLAAVAEEPGARELILGGGTASASALLAIGVAHLEGELAMARGEPDTGIAALERAVALQDALVYMEPPPWYFPTRQALGAALLDAGRPAEAEAVYRADLERNPHNGWSLFGLARSLERQGKSDEANWTQEGFRNAWAQADISLAASRF
jgi:tetratricopeptide (TPR) repeat protein